MEVLNMRVSPLLRAAFLLIFMACSVSSVNGYNQFKVGEQCGWTLNPDETYSHWAERNRFQVNDTLYFKYNKTVDSVLLVDKDDYDHCTATKPFLKLEGGESVFKFDRSGPFYFITGNLTNCQNGQKLVVVVLAVRPPPPSSPVQPPRSPPADPSPAEEPSASAPSSPESSLPKKKSSAAAVFVPAAALFSAACGLMGLIVIN